LFCRLAIWAFLEDVEGMMPLFDEVFAHLFIDASALVLYSFWPKPRRLLMPTPS
jgi:hypothetical protein